MQTADNLIKEKFYIPQYILRRNMLIEKKLNWTEKKYRYLFWSAVNDEQIKDSLIWEQVNDEEMSTYIKILLKCD